jgi:hypothetical protein
LNDYNHLQVNHIDGNTFNNHANNLEWCNQSQNMSHAYDSNLNKKQRAVLQYDKDTNELIQEFPSIAEASRQTGEYEHAIRACSQKSKLYRQTKWIWKMKKPSKNEEYSLKYSTFG